MTDDIQGQDIEVKVNPEVVPASETPADSLVKDQVTEGSLPEGASERTKQEFDKLKNHNKELADRLSRYEQSQKVSVLDSLKPKAVVDNNYQNLDQQQVDDVVKGLIDENGYVDEALLKKTLNESNVKAQQALQEARQTREEVSRFSQSQQTQKTHLDFPEVNPDSDKFNPELYDLVRNELVGQMLEGQQDFYSATKKWVDKLKPKNVTESQESIVAKEHINSVGQSRPDTKTSEEELVMGTIAGDESAINERLKRAGY